MRDGTARCIASASEIDAVGHRVVHGGPHFRVPVLITHEVRETIDSMSAFAPLHIRVELEGMRIIESLLGTVTQVAIFDTGFHSEMALWAAVVQKRHSPLRFPRHQSSVLRRACRTDARSASESSQNRELSSRERLLSHGNSRRPQHRYHNGLHPPRGSDDGDTVRFGGSSNLDLPYAPRSAGCRGHR